jgi:hypothetical protein
MFSITTIASSTTKPVATVSAMSDRLSIENPQRYMTPSVAISETGTTTLGMKVERRLRRKRNTTRITSAIETARVISTSRTDARIVRVASMATPRRIVGGNRRLELRHQRPHAVYGVDDVRSRLAEDDEEHGRLAVGDPGRANVLDRIGHAGDVREAHRRALRVVDDQRLVVRGLEQLVRRGDRPRLRAGADLPLGPVRVGGVEGGPHVVEPEPVVVQRERVHVDPDGGQRAASDEHLSHPRQLRELLLEHGRRDVVHAGALHEVRSHGEDDHRRVGRVDLAIRGVVRQVRGKLPARRVDGGLDVARRGVDVAREVELERHVGGAERARRRHLRDAGDPPELPLQRRGDGRRHGVRVRAGEAGLDVDRRELDLRQRRDGKELERHDPGERERDREKRRRDRSPDEGLGERHADSAARRRPLSGRRRRFSRAARRSNAR